MNYAEIKYFDIANGEGIRTSLFVSGCTHHCPGCFNEVAWDFHYGNEFTKEIEDQIIESLKSPYIAGLTLLGGEPFEPANQRGLVTFLKRVKEECPDKTIWCFTGFLYEDLIEGGRVHIQATDEMISYLDVLVDGPFILDQKDISLKFKGSRNQRTINVKKTLESGELTLLF